MRCQQGHMLAPDVLRFARYSTLALMQNGALHACIEMNSKKSRVRLLSFGSTGLRKMPEILFLLIFRSRLLHAICISLVHAPSHHFSSSLSNS